MAARTRVVLGQVAIVFFALAGQASRPLMFAVMTLGALMMLAAVWPAHRRRPVGALPVGAPAPALLGLLRPGAATVSLDADGAAIGVIDDADGLAAIVRVGDPPDLLGAEPPPMPPLLTLLPAPAGQVPQVRVQAVFAAAHAPPSASPVALAYRQVTADRVPVHRQTLVAVRVRRVGGFRDADLRRSLLVAVRRVCRVLDRAGLPARPLAAAPALAALAEAAQHDPAHPVREARGSVQVGGLQHIAFRLREWPPEGLPVARLLDLPAAMVTVAVVVQAVALTARQPTSAGSAPPPADEQAGLEALAELVVRIAAPTADGLGQAARLLQEQVGLFGGAVERLDGHQLDGLAATVPIGGGASGDDAVLAGLITGRDGLAVGGGRPTRIAGDRIPPMRSGVGGDGLMIGLDRHGAPLVVHLFRSEPTLVGLVGGPACARLLVVRALATGARVLIQSTRPQLWEAFQRGLGPEALSILPPGRLGAPPSATALRPQLLLLDTGPVTEPAAAWEAGPWRTVLYLRDELTAGDAGALSRADLTILQPLSPTEAAVADEALALGQHRDWITRIAPEMVGLVFGRRRVRWAVLSPGPMEQRLIGGSPARQATRPGA